MSDPSDNARVSRPDPSEETTNKPLKSEAEPSSGNSESADRVGQNSPSASASSADDEDFPTFADSLEETSSPSKYVRQNHLPPTPKAPLAMVETAFLASAASLIWLINYYFPLGLILRMFFPLPIALVYLRWGSRASWMAALVSGLLLSVLMGPTRSILFFIPYALMGVQLGAMWRRQSDWLFSIFAGTLLGTLGFFFRFWLLSILLGEDLWVYLMTQITAVAELVFVWLGVLAQPSLSLIQAVALVIVVLNNVLYLFVVHLVALLLFDRIGNPIPRPPNWVLVILDYDG